MKSFLATDKTGHSDKPYNVTESQLIEFWELDEQDNSTGQTLEEFIAESELGDTWETNSVTIQRIQ